MTHTYMGGAAAFSPLFYGPVNDPVSEIGAHKLAWPTPEKIKSSEEEIDRLRAEARKVAGRTRKENKRSVAILGRSPFISVWDRWTAEETKVGLPNPGDLCYRNVVLQLYAHAPAVIRWARWYNQHHIPAGVPCEVGKDTAVCKPCIFYAFLASYWNSGVGHFEEKVNDLWSSIFQDWKKGKMTGVQDPAEFISELYFQVLEDMPFYLRDDLPGICDTGVVIGKKCRGDNNACPNILYRPQNGFPVFPITFRQDSKFTSVEEAITEHLTRDLYEGPCHLCGRKSYERKYITHPAEFFLVHLNRDGRTRKIENPVDFGRDIKLKADLFDPRINKTWTQNVNYELTSVIFHSGATPQEGHYTIIVKGRTGKWTMIDDETTRAISLPDLSKLPKYKNSGYIFAYTRTTRHPTEEKMIRYQKIFTAEGLQKRRGTGSSSRQSQNQSSSSRQAQKQPGETYSEPMEIESNPSTAMDIDPSPPAQPKTTSSRRTSSGQAQDQPNLQELHSDIQKMLSKMDAFTGPLFQPTQPQVTNSDIQKILSKLDSCTASSAQSTESGVQKILSEVNSQTGPPVQSTESQPTDPEIKKLLQKLTTETTSSTQSIESKMTDLLHRLDSYVGPSVQSTEICAREILSILNSSDGMPTQLAGPILTSKQRQATLPGTNRSVMSDAEFEMGASQRNANGRGDDPKEGELANNTYLRVQYFEYNATGNPNDTYKVPLDFYVRGKPINNILDPAESGVLAKLRELGDDQISNIDMVKRRN